MLKEATDRKIILSSFIWVLLISQVRPQQNDEMEEAELSPPNENSIFQSETPTPKVIPTTSSPPSDQPYPHNILKREVRYPAPFVNSSCIIFQGAIQLHLNNSLMFGKNTDLKMDVPIDAVGSGLCGNMTQTLSLNWQRGGGVSRIEYSLQLDFGLSPNSNQQYDIQEVYLFVTKYNDTTEPKIMQGDFVLDAIGPFDPVDLNHSFICISGSKIVGTNLTIITSSLQFEAFRPKTSTHDSFSVPQVCNKDNSTVGTVIGIAVGSVLVLLLAIAFGSYVGFRYGYCRWPCCNRRNDGYQRLDI